MPGRSIYPTRGEGPAGNLPPGSIGQSELADNAAGLSAVADPIQRQYVTVNVGHNVAAADNWPLLRGGADAPQVLGIYVNTGVQMYHAAGEADTWIFNVKNITRNVSLNAKGASLSGVTLASTAWKQVPVNLGNGTIGNGETLQFQLTESGTAQTLDQVAVMVVLKPTVNS